VTDPEDCLKGWKAIAEYLEVSVRTAQAYHRRLQLPITFYNKSSVSASPVDLEKWKVTRLASALERFSSTFNEPRIQAPLCAEFLFYVFMSPQNCDAITGDLEERFRLIYSKFGRRRANFWYWWQTAISLGPIVWVCVKKKAMKPALTLAAWALGKGLIGHDGWLALVVEWFKRSRT
jgi:hypothetical protein